MKVFPEEWQATKNNIASGWKNNPKILSKITEAVNDDIYIDDESDFMEKMDIVLEWLKERYKIENL